jgi:hypothetical protein
METTNSMAQKKNKWLLLLLLVIFQTLQVSAQFTQTIRGTITDPILQSPIAGATITIAGTQLSALSDDAGNFRFREVPAGSYSLVITHIGYKEGVFSNIVVNTGKEVVLTLSLEVKVRAEKEVVVTANSRKNRPLNDMSMVSSRAFTVEETQKYAAAVNDPLRMATGFAGVVAADDGNNDIVIRGNSPAGLLWRMEGIDIPNPNHFGVAGGSGGGISILSTQLLSNSDFITGAFAAEYGNALSGVFDLKLRKGNNEKKEYTVQAGILGLNLAAEGPFSKNYKGSYLVNYRYSTLALLSKAGVDIAGGTTTFQDLAYNIYLPTKNAGTFTLFGFGGLSSDNGEPVADSTKWEVDDDRFGYNFKSNTAAAGITHTISLGYKTTLRSAVSYSVFENSFDEQFVEEDKSISVSQRNNHKTRKWIFSTQLNHKFSNQHSLRAGAMVNLIHYNFFILDKENITAPLLERINVAGDAQTVQAYAQWQYKPLNNLTFNAGLHYLELTKNNTRAIEPRGAIKWDVNRKNTIAFGYGLHSQVQPLGVYFAKDPDDPAPAPNADLEFTKAHHFVLSYARALGNSLRMKAELYYQHLFNVPVSVDPGKTFSTLNVQNDFTTDALVNKGKGRNYGMELTLEQSLNNNLYYILNGSLYESKYTALDGVERNTRFNGNYVFNAVAGKEFPLKGQRKVLGINLRVIYAGGFRNTPVDIERSKQEGYAVYYEKEAFTQQNSDYFRPDLRVSLKWNRKKLTSTLSLDIQNLVNRSNIYNTYYDTFSKTIRTNYQNGMIPVINYKIEF